MGKIILFATLLLTSAAHSDNFGSANLKEYTCTFAGFVTYLVEAANISSDSPFYGKGLNEKIYIDRQVVASSAENAFNKLISTTQSAKGLSFHVAAKNLVGKYQVAYTDGTYNSYSTNVTADSEGSLDCRSITTP